MRLEGNINTTQNLSAKTVCVAKILQLLNFPIKK